MSSSAKYKWLRQRPQRCLHIPRFQVDGQEGLITGGPSGEPQAEKGLHLENRISFDRNQKPEGICGSQEGGVHQVSTEQSNQVTYSLLRKRPPRALSWGPTPEGWGLGECAQPRNSTTLYQVPEIEEVNGGGSAQILTVLIRSPNIRLHVQLHTVGPTATNILGT